MSESQSNNNQGAPKLSKHLLQTRIPNVNIFILRSLRVSSCKYSIKSGVLGLIQTGTVSKHEKSLSDIELFEISEEIWTDGNSYG